MRQTLKLRSSRVTVLSRFALAAILIVSLWFDPTHPFAWSLSVISLFWGYMLFSAVLALVCWSDWWLAHRLRRVAFAVDFLTAFLVLYLIESAGENLISPFMGFFMFLVLTGTLIWRTKAVVTIVASMLALYAALGLKMMEFGQLVDPNMFFRRLAFMGLLGSIVIWLGHTRSNTRPDRLDWPFDTSMSEQFGTIVDFVQRHMRAGGVAFFWAPTDEPWIYLGVSGIAGHQPARLAPDAIDMEIAPEEPESRAVLFDRVRCRSLHLMAEGEVAARRGKAQVPAAEFLGIETGICLPVISETGIGRLVMTGLPGISGDHLESACGLGAEIAAAIDRHVLAEMGRSKSLAQLRLSMARELHDGVSQSLAGTSFRLESLAQAHRTGKDITADLEGLRLALAREQENLKEFIYRLRMGDTRGLESNLNEALQTVCADARRRWGIACDLDCQTPNARIPTLLVRQLDRIINEGVANAVKHGHAKKVDVTVRREVHSLLLTIGNLHSEGLARSFQPRTIAERVSELGGSLEVLDDGIQTLLQITLPVSAEK